MTFLQRALATALALSLLGGCASNICEDLVFQETPALSPPLVMPAGVPAVTAGGQYRVPGVETAGPVEGCRAQPPMTLPPELLVAPEEEGEEEA